MYITIIIYGFAILLFFRIMSYLNRILPFSKKVKHYTSMVLPAIELISWTGFLIWCMQHLYNLQDYITIIILGVFIVLLIVPAGFLIRDYLHGTLLQLQHKIKTDERIEIGELKGIITKTDHFTFDIKTDSGEIKTIPYNKIRSDIISKNAANINLEKQVISFDIPSNRSIGKIIPQLKTTLMNSPWMAASQEPVIKIISAESENYLVEAIVYVIKKEHAERIAEYVRNNFIETQRQ